MHVVARIVSQKKMFNTVILELRSIVMKLLLLLRAISVITKLISTCNQSCMGVPRIRGLLCMIITTAVVTDRLTQGGQHCGLKLLLLQAIATFFFIGHGRWLARRAAYLDLTCKQWSKITTRAHTERFSGRGPK